MPITSPDNRFGKRPEESALWTQIARKVNMFNKDQPTGWLCAGQIAIPTTEIELLEMIPDKGLHIQTRQTDWLVSLPEELRSVRLLKAIVSAEVDYLSAPCELLETSSGSSTSSIGTIEENAV